LTNEEKKEDDDDEIAVVGNKRLKTTNTTVPTATSVRSLPFNNVLDDDEEEEEGLSVAKLRASKTVTTFASEKLKSSKEIPAVVSIDSHGKRADVDAASFFGNTIVAKGATCSTLIQPVVNEIPVSNKSDSVQRAKKTKASSASKSKQLTPVVTTVIDDEDSELAKMDLDVISVSTITSAPAKVPANSNVVAIESPKVVSPIVQSAVVTNSLDSTKKSSASPILNSVKNPPLELQPLFGEHLAPPKGKPGCLDETKWVISGELESMTRDQVSVFNNLFNYKEMYFYTFHSILFSFF
jgi:hypothetical protein